MLPTQKTDKEITVIEGTYLQVMNQKGSLYIITTAGVYCVDKNFFDVIDPLTGRHVQEFNHKITQIAKMGADNV